MRWRSTSYTVDEHGVHWQSGIVRKKQTTVPLDHIQGLDTVAGPVQRLFGVWRRTCRPRAAAPRARWCSTRSARRRSSGCARRCPGGGPKSSRTLRRARPARAAAEPARRAARGAHRRPARRDPAGCGGRLPALHEHLPERAGCRAGVAAGARHARRPGARAWWPDPRPAWAIPWPRGRRRRSRASPSRALRRPTADPARAAAAHRGGAARYGACTPCAWSRACCGGRSGSPRCGSRSPATPRRPPPRARSSRSCDAPRSSRSWPRCCRSWPTTRGGLDAASAARCPARRAAERPAAWPGRGRRGLRPLPAVAPWPLLVTPLLALYGSASTTARRAGGCATGGLRMRSRRLAWSTSADARRAAAAALRSRRARCSGAPAWPTSRWRSARAATRRSRHLELPVAAELWERLRR